MADARNRQSARSRLREIQMRQRAVATAYERAVTADEAAEEGYRAAVARAEQDRATVRRARVVALAGLAATVRDQEACAVIADVPAGEVRHAVRDAAADEVEQFLRGVSAPRADGRGSAAETAAELPDPRGPASTAASTAGSATAPPASGS